MISLDKKIFDKDSYVAKRMIAYGIVDPLFILLPSSTDKFMELSPEVKVWGLGGNKVQIFFNIIKKGKKIINKNIIDTITAQDPFFTGLIGFILKKKTDKKLEIQVHGDFFGGTYYKKSGIKNLFQYYLANFIVKKADIIRVVGQRIKDSLIKLKIDENKIKVKPIEINEEEINNHTIQTDLKKKYSNYKKIFLSIGRLEVVKNINFLIDVFAEVLKDKVNGEAREGALGQKKDFLLLIVGSGSQEKILKEKVENLGLSNNIKFEDWTEDHISYIKTCDAVLFPSLSEGYGLVPMEADVCGTKVIMSNVGVANFELDSSDDVIILPINDKEKFIHEIKNI